MNLTNRKLETRATYRLAREHEAPRIRCGKHRDMVCFWYSVLADYYGEPRNDQHCPRLDRDRLLGRLFLVDASVVNAPGGDA